MKNASVVKNAIRIIALVAVVAGYYAIPQAEADCYSCKKVGSSGSECRNDGGPGFTKCEPIQGGGCDPDGGDPCPKKED